MQRVNMSFFNFVATFHNLLRNIEPKLKFSNPKNHEKLCK